MPFKDPEVRKAHHRKYMREVWYPGNQSKHMGSVRASKQKRLQTIREMRDQIKRESGCVDCGIKDIRVLDFDHVKGSKELVISEAMGQGLSINRILRELSKCVVRCANCHRTATWEHRERKKTSTFSSIAS